ncbi:MAG: hypothetical protein E7K47_08160, partial [Acidovorax sp.]|nr:hypothetical protein [Acidovorax sp.]
AKPRWKRPPAVGRSICRPAFQEARSQSLVESMMRPILGFSLGIWGAYAAMQQKIGGNQIQGKNGL